MIQEIEIWRAAFERQSNNEWPTLLPDKFNERVTILSEMSGLQHSDLKNPSL